MHFKPLVLTTIFTILAVAKAQIIAPAAWWASLDPCALQCAQKAADKAGCNLNDIKCLCNSTSFWTDFKNCVQLSCPLVSDVSSSPTAVFNKACTQLDWTWGLDPCLRDCLLKAAQTVGCALNDRICLCKKKAAFLAAFYACARNCPVLYETAQDFIATNFICPVVDPTLTIIHPTLTAIDPTLTLIDPTFTIFDPAPTDTVVAI